MITAELEVMELMDNSTGAYPSPSAMVPVPREISDLADTLKELKLFMQKTVAKGKLMLPREQLASSVPMMQSSAGATLGPSLCRPPVFKRGPPVCDYCKEMGHMQNRFADFFEDQVAEKVCCWGQLFFWPNNSPVEGAVPQDAICGATPSSAKGGETMSKANMGALIGGKAWKPPTVTWEVHLVKTGEVFLRERLERMDLHPIPVKPKPKETPMRAPPVPGQRKAAKIAQCALGSKTSVSLTLRKLAAISPMRAEELIMILQDSSPEKEKLRAAQTAVAEIEGHFTNMDLLPLHTVSCLLGYIEMRIGGQTAWAIIDRGSMINIILAAELTQRKMDINIRTMGGFTCMVERVVEKERVEVAKVSQPLYFLVTHSKEVSLG